MTKLVTSRFDKVLASGTLQELKKELHNLGFQEFDDGPFINFKSDCQDLGSLGHRAVRFKCYRPVGYRSGSGQELTVQSYVKVSPYKTEKLFKTFRVKTV